MGRITTSRSVTVLRECALNFLQKKGFPQEEALAIFDVLLYAQLRDNNQGLQKLAEMRHAPEGPIEVAQETNVSCLINGNYNHSMVVLAKACAMAVERAGKQGMAVVGTNRTNTSSGAVGYFTSKIARENGMIAILAATTRPIVAPLGGKNARIGTNPISIAFPAEGDPIVFDATTAAMAFYGVKEAAMKNEELPLGVALDSDGDPTTDPQKALKGILLPRGVMGWGMGVVVQLLAGPLVEALREPADTNNWGHILIVIDPRIFGIPNEEYRRRVSAFTAWVKTSGRHAGISGTQPKVEEVLLPGERGAALARERFKADDVRVELDDKLYYELFPPTKGRSPDDGRGALGF